MKKYIWMFFGVALVLVIVVVIYKREQDSKKSPKENFAFQDGDLNIEVVYSRPSKRGRNIFGALVPYDKIWRTGANEATEFHTNKNLDFNGQVLPSGVYSVWTQPGSDTWKVFINSSIPEWGINENGIADRNPDTDIVVVDVASEVVTDITELFTMKVEESTSGYNLVLNWDNVKVTVPFTQK